MHNRIPLIYITFLSIFFFLSPILYGQQVVDREKDASIIQQIYQLSLKDGQCYDWLEHISLQIGHRLSGSVQAEKAVQYTSEVLESIELDSVWLQPCMVPAWKRGGPEQMIILDENGKETELTCTAIGNTIGTGSQGISGDIIELKSLDAIDSLTRDQVEEKIVFYNGKMDPGLIHTFHAYGKAAGQRYWGPHRAAKLGAKAVIVRSLTQAIDDVPHTGTSFFDHEGVNVPAVAISTKAAELLSSELSNREVTGKMYTECHFADSVMSANVIGEIRGSEFPEKIIVVGGHLDSWDLGHGSHDDGAGCVQSMEVLRMLQKIGYKPRHTIRCVLFMNEENGIKGALKYAKEAEASDQFHMAALESDAGGFTPRGFSFDAEESVFENYFKQVMEWEPLMEPYGLEFKKGGSGVDVGRLKKLKGLLIGYRPDAQRYFDYHHTAEDTIDKVNQRELEMGAASMTALVYLIDKYGLL